MIKLKRLYMILWGVTIASFSALTLVYADTKVDVVQAYLDRAIVSYERGDLPGAIAELREALSLRPDDSQVSFMLGNALYRHGDLHGAACAYQIALEHRPNPFEFEAHMSRGFALYELGEFKEAVAEWLAAVRVIPQEPFARAGLAVGLYRLGQIKEAKAQYAKALALDARYGDTEILRIDIRWKANTVGVLERLKAINPDEIIQTPR